MPLFFHTSAHAVPHLLAILRSATEATATLAMTSPFNRQGVLHMNYKFLMKNVALSALLISAIASPVSANPSKDPGAILKLQPIGSASIMKDSLSVSNLTMAMKVLDNPIELAKKYAPDTVANWTATLDKFHQFSGFTAVELKPIAPLVNVEQSAIKITPATKINSSNAKELMNLIKLDKIEWNDKLDQEKITAAIKIVDGSAAKVLKEDQHKMQSITINTTGATISPAHKLVMVGQKELQQAVEAKDEAAIQTELAKLLNTYKVAITKLEQAAK